MTIPAFIESPRFPDTVGFGSTGGPGFKTEVFTSTSGHEQRNVMWSSARCEYNITSGVQTKEDMDEVLGFFYQTRGRATAFRYKDWGDFTLTNELIGTGNGAQTSFQIIKTYGTVNPYVRTIQKPVSTTDIILVNGNPLTRGVDYSIDYTTGTVTFVSPPANTHPIRVTCEFDVPCRFDVDQLPLNYAEWQTMEFSGVKIVEVRL